MATKGRSPNYPAVGLKTAIALVQKLYDRERRALVTADLAATDMGFKGLSGPTRTKVSSLRKYGLVDEVGGKVRVSDLAMQILFPRSPEQRLDAIAQAAAKPELFRDLEPLAQGSDANMTNHLVHMGFTVQGARQAIESFRETFSLLDGQERPLEDSLDEAEEIAVGQPGSTMPARGQVGAAGSPFGNLLTPGTEAATFTWLLPRGVVVELRFTGGPYTRESIEVLRKYLDVMETAIAPQTGGAEPKAD